MVCRRRRAGKVAQDRVLDLMVRGGGKEEVAKAEGDGARGFKQARQREQAGS